MILSSVINIINVYTLHFLLISNFTKYNEIICIILCLTYNVTQMNPKNNVKLNYANIDVYHISYI